jgi:manganese/zinc/iron transport system ATP- binding protein
VRPRAAVAYVPQRDAVDWDFPITVREVVEMGPLRPHGLDAARAPRRRPARGGVPRPVGMADYGSRQIGQLSGGQRQRVFVARALAQEAPVMMHGRALRGSRRPHRGEHPRGAGELRDEGRSAIVVHHDLATVRSASTGPCC